MGKILVACEESQTVTKAFRKLGHEAYSCDIVPCSGRKPEWHIQKDVLELLDGEWDMIIAFPPCTHLAVSGARHFKQKWLDGRQKEAVDFFMRFVKSKCKRVAIENPVGIMNTYYRKPDQVIQPWQFGHNESKRTCLWLKGLPALKCGDIMPPAGYQEVVYAGQLHPCECCGEPWCELHQEHYADCKCFGPTQDNLHYVKIEGFEFATDIQPPPKPLWGNQTSSGQNKLGQRPDRAMLRSKTYKGIAEAMAKQWGKLIPVGK